jgi:hypothetical protein
VNGPILFSLHVLDSSRGRARLTQCAPVRLGQSEHTRVYQRGVELVGRRQ